MKFFDLNAESKYFLIIFKDISLENYTCFKCPLKETCEYAWDDYNTNGDCLAEK